MDKGRELADKELLKLERSLSKEYATAKKEIRAKYNKFTRKIQEKDKEKRALLATGAITRSDYDEWRANQTYRSKWFKDMIATLAKDQTAVNKRAAAIINGTTSGVYAEQFNYGTYLVEKGIKADTAFTLYNKDAVKNINAKADIKITKDIAWNKRKINSALMQGILQGESIPDIANRLARIPDMNAGAAVRNARTLMTSAENEGRLDSFERAANMGINLKKTWVATIDDRVRESHAELDGETVPIDEPFSNGLMYPADPSGDDPAEIYNCRCTMITQIAGFERDVTDLNIRPAKIGSYEEWKAVHAKRNPVAQSAVKTGTVAAVGEKINAQLAESYEYHRVANNLNETPYDDELRTVVTSNFKNLSEGSARAFEDSLADLMAEYDTPLQKVRSMTKEEAFYGLENSFASVVHNYSTDSAELLINPIKCKDYQKLVDRIKELSDDGYCVKIAENKAKEYVATHEFAHTLIDMESTLSNKRNWVNADYAKVRSVRKEIKSIYDEYIKELEPLKEKWEAANSAYFESFDEALAKEVVKYEDMIAKIQLSDYSLESADEFMAEAFTFARIGKGKNKYADKVKKVLDKYYKR